MRYDIDNGFDGFFPETDWRPAIWNESLFADSKFIRVYIPS